MPSCVITNAAAGTFLLQLRFQVLSNEGLTISDFVCSVLSMLVKERKLPFDAKVPNKLPAQTLVKSARNKGLHQTKDVEDLFKKIGNLIRQDAP